MNELVIRGRRVSQDADGYVSLTDMWRIAGKDDNRSAARWRVLPATKALIQALSQNSRFSAVIKNSKTKSAIYSKSGKGGGTYAHPILALAYAEYLSPEIGVEARDIALRFWSRDVTLLDEFHGERRRQVKDDERRVFLREEIRKDNELLDARLRKTGAGETWQIQEFHDAGYRGLYDGRDEQDIHEIKDLDRGQKILDHMTPAEAAANWFRTTQAEERVKKAETFRDACAIHQDTGERIRATMKELGGVMPEDMPAAGGIRAAKRRLTVARKIGKGE